MTYDNPKLVSCPYCRCAYYVGEVSKEKVMCPYCEKLVILIPLRIKIVKSKIATKEAIYELLGTLGFEKVDITDNGFDILRSGNKEIIIEYRHIYK